MGKVYLVGAGPGDPELLTVKAARLLARAGVVFHDSLVSREVLGSITRDAEVIDVKSCRVLRRRLGRRPQREFRSPIGALRRRS